jgi:hypothetical protein
VTGVMDAPFEANLNWVVPDKRINRACGFQRIDFSGYATYQELG